MARGNTTRRLRVDIEGDPNGFDQAARQAEAAARAFDRQLQDLERSERQATEQAERNAAALRRLEHAQEQARDAAGRLERGEIDAAEAAKLQEDAEKQLERVLRANAAAERAAARAANELADEQRKAAREAEIAAGKQRLAQLRAAGATKDHDRTLHQMMQMFPELGDSGDQAFTRMADSGAKASGVFSSIPTSVVAILVLLEILPILASIAGGAITMALGGALVALGMKAAASSEQVQRALTGLKDHVGDVTKEISKPFEKTWLQIAKTGRQTFDELVPVLRESFGELAPAMSSLVQGFGAGLARFGPAIHAISDAFSSFATSLGRGLPSSLGALAGSLQDIANAVDPQEFANFVNGMIHLTAAVFALLPPLIRLNSTITDFGKTLGSLSWDDIGNGLGRLIHPTGTAADKMRALEGAANSAHVGAGLAALGFGDLGGAVTSASGSIGRATPGLQAIKDGLKAASDETSKLDQRLKGLQDSMNAALNPSLALYNSQTQVAEGMASLRKAVHDAGGSLNNTSAASRAARQAFSSQIATVRDLGSNTLAATGSTDRMRKAVEAQLPRLYQLAGSNKSARAQVDRLADAFGASSRQANGAKGKTDALKRSIGGLKGKRVPIDADTARAQDQIHSLINRFNNMVINIGVNALLGAVGARADGGLVGGYADGGRVRRFPFGGLIHGPGGPRDDMVPLMASNKEYIVNAKATAENLPLLEAINSGRTGGASGPMMQPRPVPGSASGPMMQPRPVPGGGSVVVHATIEMDGKVFGRAVIDVGRAHADRNFGKSAFATVRTRS